MFSPLAKYVHGSSLKVPYTPVGFVGAGSVIVINGVLGIAMRDIAAGVGGSLEIPSASSVYDFVKDASTFNDRDLAYWNAGASEATSTSGGNPLIGIALGGAATGDGTVRVQMLPITSATTITTQSPVSANAIADPGNAGAIAVTASGHVELVTAGAETRTLAAPSFIGEQLLISMKTHGGDCVITCATTVNVAGNNTITFGAVQDQLFLIAVANGTNKRWSLVSKDGATLSTV